MGVSIGGGLRGYLMYRDLLESSQWMVIGMISYLLVDTIPIIPIGTYASRKEVHRDSSVQMTQDH